MRGWITNLESDPAATRRRNLWRMTYVDGWYTASETGDTLLSLTSVERKIPVGDIQVGLLELDTPELLVGREPGWSTLLLSQVIGSRCLLVASTITQTNNVHWIDCKGLTCPVRIRASAWYTMDDWLHVQDAWSAGDLSSTLWGVPSTATVEAPMPPLLVP
ncbi:hypothetical protein PG2006B_1089 [Bifidobacterium animalis subsp. animalis]|uniref:hypothetical protein n=1 Tax=Bifidobacterium animalis TaxID=28025 RepID=UPI00101FDCE8|nr:hypothetical protein [Bifidobacterium animalis]RYN13515.1 hypothetical protein PG2006B_1089 [Bifidobacterium animalis subsp. animalis]